MADAVSAAAGDVVNNRYTLTERVNDWGIGEAWRANDARFADRPVVVKLLPPGDAGLTPMVLARLEAARALRHPHVLPLVDHGVWNGREFAVHEHGVLRSLGAWLDDHRARGELPSLEDLKVIIAHIAAALGAAHRESPALIHEGLSPACVMLREGDAGLRARLFDFGIVPFADPIEADPGSARGVACMAPEQFQGEPADRRTDIFALGLLCFELLTALPDATSSERYRGRGDVPEAVWRALQTALTTERDGRYASVEALLEVLTPAWDQPLERAPHPPAAGETPDTAAPAGDVLSAPHATAAPSYDYAPSADDPRALRYQYTADDIAPELLSTTTAPVQIPAEVAASRAAYQLPELPELPEARTVSFDAAAIFAGVAPAAVADTLSTMRSNRDPRALMEMTRRYRMQAAAQAAAAPAPAPAPAPVPAPAPAPKPAVVAAPRAPAPAPAAKPSGSRRVVVAVFAMLLSFGAVLGVVWLLFRARRH